MASESEKEKEASAIAASVAGIWAAAGVPVAEKRRLAARAATATVFAASGRLPRLDTGEPPSCERLEEALEAVSELTGGRGPRPIVSEAKEQLRRRGLAGRRLASRVGKLSRARNAASHPDVGLAREIRQLLQDEAKCEDFGQGSGSGESAASVLQRSPG